MATTYTVARITGTVVRVATREAKGRDGSPFLVTSAKILVGGSDLTWVTLGRDLVVPVQGDEVDYEVGIKADQYADRDGVSQLSLRVRATREYGVTNTASKPLAAVK